MIHHLIFQIIFLYDETSYHHIHKYRYSFINTSFLLSITLDTPTPCDAPPSHFKAPLNTPTRHMYAVKKGKQEKIEPPPFRARAPAGKRNCDALRSRRLTAAKPR